MSWRCLQYFAFNHSLWRKCHLLELFNELLKDRRSALSLPNHLNEPTYWYFLQFVRDRRHSGYPKLPYTKRRSVSLRRSREIGSEKKNFFCLFFFWHSGNKERTRTTNSRIQVWKRKETRGICHAHHEVYLAFHVSFQQVVNGKALQICTWRIQETLKGFEHLPFAMTEVNTTYSGGFHPSSFRT